MARSPLTLAAAVTSALPRAGVVGVAALTESAAGRFDSALVDLDDGRRAVVRIATSDETSAELVAEARALRALTPGVRALLPFAAPELFGETTVEHRRAIVVGYLPGYRVEAAHVPAGRGAAHAFGAALAAVHALPVSVPRADGLPVLAPVQVRDGVSRMLDRVATTHRIPVSLLSRWSRAVADERLWRFESAVMLGGVGPEAFVFSDADDAGSSGPHIVGLLDWHGLSGGDPAADLRWLASAPTSADDVYAAYVAASSRAPDAALRTRARLYAELEFARWLLHGADAGDDAVVDDAVSLLESLAASVRDDDLAADDAMDLDDAIALLDRVPDAAATVAADTSMQTDAYDPEVLAYALDDESEEGSAMSSGTADQETAPIEMSEWLHAREDAGRDSPTDDDGAAAERAADAALRRWASSD